MLFSADYTTKGGRFEGAHQSSHRWDGLQIPSNVGFI